MRPTCSIHGCAQPATRRSWCDMHYRRWQRHGSTDDPTPSAEVRFMRRIKFVGDCWIWTGSRFESGYGQFCEHGRNWRAHKWAYEHWIGPVEDGLVLDHVICGTPACVNPEHLEATTCKVNLMRSDTTIASINAAKTRCPQGHLYDACRLSDHGRLCMICMREKSAERYRQRQFTAATMASRKNGTG